MVSMLEPLATDIKTALTDSSDFSDFTFYRADMDEDEDADYEYDVPNIIYGTTNVPIDYFMDGSRIMRAEVVFNLNVSEFDTLGGLTRKRLVNEKLDKLQDTLSDMVFTSLTPINYDCRGGEQVGKEQIGEDEFLYRGMVTMSIEYLDGTT
jgi:hypothetical protein|tara:strand:+ start:107 stop:559 length:453 start_codon:yes stop_codon:yes gene_type:complete